MRNLFLLGKSPSLYILGPMRPKGKFSSPNRSTPESPDSPALKGVIERDLIVRQMSQLDRLSSQRTVFSPHLSCSNLTQDVARAPRFHAGRLLFYTFLRGQSRADIPLPSRAPALSSSHSKRQNPIISRSASRAPMAAHLPPRPHALPRQHDRLGRGLFLCRSPSASRHVGGTKTAVLSGDMSRRCCGAVHVHLL